MLLKRNPAVGGPADEQLRRGVQRGSVLLLAMGQHSADSYRAVLRVDDIEMRVASLGAYLIGVTFSRYVLREGPWRPRVPRSSKPAWFRPSAAFS